MEELVKILAEPARHLSGEWLADLNGLSIRDIRAIRGFYSGF
jgi:hypothetical protein